MASVTSAEVYAWFWVTFVSMLPVVELRGAIPLGLGLGLSPLAAFSAALVGNLLIVPLLLWLVPALVAWLEHYPWFKKPWDRLEARLRLKGEDAVQRYGALGLLLFVAVPLPGSGAWTGSLIAVVLGLKKRYAWSAISLGVVIAGVLVTLAATGVLKGLEWMAR
ncbi:COG2426 family protein [Oceanithermus sp.]